VVIIDEYDAPIVQNIHDLKKCEEIRDELAKFYKILSM